MLELMLNISDYQPWLKSMLALAHQEDQVEKEEDGQESEESEAFDALHAFR